MKLEATRNTPAVDLTFADGDKWTGEGCIRGELYHGATAEFFDRVQQHLCREFVNHQGREYKIEIELFAFPTTAEEYILRLLTALRGCANEGAELQIIWLYNSASRKGKQIAQQLEHDFGRRENGKPFLVIK